MAPAPESQPRGGIDPYSPFRGTLLSTPRVRELSLLRPAIPVRDALICWLWIVTAWTAVAMVPLWWVVLLAIPLIGNRYYALFIIGHDGFHRRIFDSVQRNDLFCDLMIYASIGAITRINKRNHLAHHTHLSTDRDPDRYKHSCFHHSTRAAMVGYLTGVTSVGRSLVAVFLSRKRSASLNAASDAVDERQQYGPRDLLIVGAWQLGLIAGLTLMIGWWAYPLLWLVPVFVFMYLADSFRAFAEHSQPVSDREGDQRRLITFLPGRLERVLFAPMNMNFHAVHHLWPSIPYYNLPVADRESRIHPDARAIEVRKSYLQYLAYYFGVLPLPECQVEDA